MKGLERLSYKIYRLTLLISFASLLFFTGFYIYKIVTNVGHPFYLTAYIVFLVLTLLTAVIELIFMRRQDDDKETKKEKKLKRKRAKFIIKILKYVVKLATIIIAIIELATIEFTVGKLIALLFAINLFIFEVIFTIIHLRIEHKVKKMKESFEGLGIKQLFHKS